MSASLAAAEAAGTYAINCECGVTFAHQRSWIRHMRTVCPVPAIYARRLDNARQTTCERCGRRMLRRTLRSHTLRRHHILLPDGRKR